MDKLHLGLWGLWDLCAGVLVASCLIGLLRYRSISDRQARRQSAPSTATGEIKVQGEGMALEEQRDGTALEEQREQVRSLWKRRRYEEASDLAMTLSDAVLIFAPCEDIADHIHKERPEQALRLYQVAAQTWIYEGTQATGSGEGLVAMDNLHRVEQKIENLKQAGR